MATPNYAFFKDRIVPYAEAKVGVLTHALNYGTACFGGLRGYWNENEKQLYVFRPLDHFQRFIESTKLLCMELPYTKEDLLKAMVDLLHAEQLKSDVYIRPLAFYGDEVIGVRLHDLNPLVSIVTVPFGRYVEKEEGAHVTVSSWRRIDDNVIPARGKIAGGYVNSAFAKTDALRSGFDEAILLNQDGHVSEGSAENIFVLRKGRFCTPSVTDNILEGITRNTIITLLRDELGMDVVERSIDRTELLLADEAFMVATGAQIVAMIRIDHRPIGTGKMGGVTQKLRDLYFSVVRGGVQKYRQWCHPVYTR
jgi:branched-chain amino acid aminotransferase